MLEHDSEEAFSIESDHSERGDIWLIPLKMLDGDARAIHLGAVAELAVEPGQRDFVGEPLRMMLISLEEESRFPYVIESGESRLAF